MRPTIQHIVKKLALRIQRPDPQKVVSIRFAITYQCDSRCRACNIWKKYQTDTDKKNSELKLDEIKSIFNNSKLLSNLKTINLTGGETTLRDDFIELCTFFIDKYPEAQINLNTNALNAESTVSKLEEIHRKLRPRDFNIYTSLDGLKNVHDKMRGVPGAHEQVLLFLKTLNEKLPSFKRGVTFTITPDNYKELLDVYRLMKESNVSFVPTFAKNSEIYYDNREKQFKWAEEELKHVEKGIGLIIADGGGSNRTMPRILREIDGVDICYLANMTNYIRNQRRLFKCFSGTHSLFMDPYGNIFPCILLNNLMGNVTKTSFDDVWTSDKAAEIRQFINDEHCSCWEPCEMYPSLSRNLKVILYNLHSHVLPPE
jgi:radical SAM protein with 4Fe4S-binding SPASM domain